MHISKLYILIISILATACGTRTATTTSADAAATPATPAVTFDTDSAMAYLKAQTDLGPRVPGTDPHSRCADWLIATLTRLGADTVIEQRATATAWNGDRLPLRNIVARFGTRPGINPVLLAAHWDTRPWADAEADPADIERPITGANDGASGVAVLLETARQAGIHGTTVPLELLIVDGEDYGSRQDHGDDTSWCLGTQQWLASAPGAEGGPYTDATRPRYAILLDMVGGRDARFHREYISDLYAPAIVDMVWQTAASLGLADRFVNEPGGAVVDDHLFLNRAGIPAIDIIESLNPATGSFNPTWHTHSDTYDNIDPATIADVGRLVTHLTIKQPLQ